MISILESESCWARHFGLFEVCANDGSTVTAPNQCRFYPRQPY
jgi:hypothetical protein